MHDRLRGMWRERSQRNVEPTVGVIDSASVKTSTQGGQEKGYDAGKKVKGRKRHLLVDMAGLVLAVIVHSAGVQARDAAFPVIAAAKQTLPMRAATHERSRRSRGSRSRSSAGRATEPFRHSSSRTYRSSNRRVDSYLSRSGGSWSDRTPGTTAHDVSRRITIGESTSRPLGSGSSRPGSSSAG
jgi:hypothetical protein